MQHALDRSSSVAGCIHCLSNSIAASSSLCPPPSLYVGFRLSPPAYPLSSRPSPLLQPIMLNPTPCPLPPTTYPRAPVARAGRHKRMCRRQLLRRRQRCLQPQPRTHPCSCRRADQGSHGREVLLYFEHLRADQGSHQRACTRGLALFRAPHVSATFSSPARSPPAATPSAPPLLYRTATSCPLSRSHFFFLSLAFAVSLL